MSVVVVVPPAPIVTMEMVKRHLRVDWADDDSLIAAYIAAAQGNIDGPTGWIGRCFGVQTLELRLADWPCKLELPYPPEIEITGIWYFDPTGIERSWPVGSPLQYVNLPLVRGQDGDIRIRYRAGYDGGEGRGSVPGPVIAAMLLMVADLYAARETVADGIRSKIDASLTVERLLHPYRIYS